MAGLRVLADRGWAVPSEQGRPGCRRNKDKAHAGDDIARERPPTFRWPPRNGQQSGTRGGTVLFPVPEDDRWEMPELGLRPTGGRAWVAALLIGVSLPAEPADWDITPRLTAAETYTDNVGLAGDEADEEEEWITQLNPGLTLARRGGRAEVDLEYRMQNLYYARESNRNNTYHQLAAHGNAELMKEAFFVEADAGYSQQIIAPEERVSLRNIDVTQNRTDVGTARISPYAVKRFGDFATSTIRYTYDQVYVERGPVSDTQSHSYLAQIESGRRFNRLGWALSYRRRDEGRRARGDTVQTESVTARTSWQATAKLNLFLSGGYERDEFRQRAGADEPEGSFWNAGFSWAPTPRTNVTASRGERFFGTTWNLTASLRTRSTRWSARYNEDVRTVQQLLLDQEVFQLTDPFGEPVIGRDGQPVFVEVIIPRLSDEVFVERRGSLSVSKDTGKSTFALRLAESEREFQEGTETDRTSEVFASWRWRFATRTYSVLSGRWRRHEVERTQTESDLQDTSLAIVRRIRRSLTGSVEFTHTEQDIQNGTDGYDQNTVTARINMRF